MLGTLFSLPYVLFFFTIWIVASISRPVFFATLICVISNPQSALYKFQLFLSTIQYLIFCNDKKWKKTEDPSPYFKDGTKVETKQVLFVRHGESLWNETFNKGDRSPINFALAFVPGIFKSIIYEWYFWVTGQSNESWFFDSPLSQKGINQAWTIQKYLRSDTKLMTPKEINMFQILLGEKKSQMVSSNLRRAIATVAIGFQDRLAKQQQDSIMILPCLQEISRNPDALSITPPRGNVLPAFSDPKVTHGIYKEQIDTSKHSGNKPLNTNGLLRMQEFCQITFDDIKSDAIIAGGHSLWFRSFFRTYLPHSVEHVAKKKKLVNGGIVGFNLSRAKDDKGNYHYMIDHTSIVVLNGGF